MKLKTSVVRYLPVVVAIHLAMLLPIQAAVLRLAWDESTKNTDGSTLANPARYTVHYGISPGVYADAVDAGTNTSIQLSNLAEGTTYYFAVCALGEEDSQSALSEELQWTIADLTPPSIASVVAVIDTTRVTVLFNEPVEAASATQTSNYMIDNGIVVESAALQSDGRTVILSTSQMELGSNYVLFVSGVEDLTGNAIVSAQRQFTLIHDIRDGLVSEWRFDEGSGNQASDVVGGRTAVLSGPRWTAGMYGSALDFNGVSDSASAGTHDPGENITISMWVKWRGAPGTNHQMLIAKRDSWSATGMRWQLVRSAIANSLIFERKDSTARFLVDIPKINEWCHIVVTKNGSDVSLYFDGTLAATSSMSFGSATAAPITIGNNQAGGPESFNGAIDDLRLYNRALTADEVVLLSTIPASPIAPDSDNNELPDDWERHYFGQLTHPSGGPDDDFDGDGATNLEEFIAGTDPTDSSDAPKLHISLIDGQVVISYPSITAQGAGYEGYTRHIKFLERTSLDPDAPEAWKEIENSVPLSSTNAVLQSRSDPSNVLFYRVIISLEN